MFARLTQTWSRVPRWLAAGAIAAMTAAGMSAPVVLTATPASAGILGTPVNAIVQGSSVSAVQSVLSTVGGTVLTPLPLVNGVLAQLPSMTVVTTLQALGLNVVPNSPVAVDSLVGASASASGTNVFPTATGADQLQAQGINGAGVGVAVLDTGIAPLPDFGSRLIAGVDFSGQGNPFLDSYGHGTFVAGLVAGDGSSSGGAYTGEAPGANLISIKVAGASGVTTVSTVIQGIAWAIANQQVYGIKVINLSLGHPVTEPSATDPLCQAVARAVAASITVVVSAGNYGLTSTGAPVLGGITSPGNSPAALTVGSLDTKGTIDPSDDEVAPYSSKGPARYEVAVKPDVVAPGTRITSLEAQNSYISTTYRQWHIAGSGKNAYLRLSGTSMSTAVVSGGVALLLNAYPSLTPAQVKMSIQMGARFIPEAGLIGAGTGSVNFAQSMKIAQNGLLNNLTTTITSLLGLSSGAAFRDQGTLIDRVYDRTGIRLLRILDLSRLFGDADSAEPGVLNLVGLTNPLGNTGANYVVWGNVAGWSNSYYVVWGNSIQSPSGQYVVWGNNEFSDPNYVVWGNSMGGGGH